MSFKWRLLSLQAFYGVRLSCVFLVFCCGRLLAQTEIPSAKDLVAEVERLVAKPAQDRRSSDSPYAELRASVDAYLVERDSLSPNAAGDRWLELVDQCRIRIREEGFNPAIGGSVTSLLQGFPGPDSWRGILDQLLDRPMGEDGKQLVNLGLRAMFGTLSNDTNVRMETTERVAALVAQEDRTRRSQMINVLEELGKALSGKGTGGDEPYLEFLDEWALFKRRRDFDSVWRIPDVVAWVGADRVREVIRQMIFDPNIVVGIKPGSETYDLAQELARESLSEFAQPQWSLALDLEATDLFEHFVELERSKNVATGGGQDGPSQMFEREIEYAADSELRALADWYRFAALLDAGLYSEATQFFEARNLVEGDLIYDAGEALSTLAERGTNRNAVEFLRFYLRRNPEPSLWDWLIEGGAVLGESASVVALLEEVMAQEDLDGDLRARLEPKRIDALIAADLPDQAVSFIREQGSVLSQKEMRRPSEQNRLLALALQLHTLGELLDRELWRDQSVEWLRSLAQELVARPASAAWNDEASRILADSKHAGLELARLQQHVVHSVRTARRDPYAIMNSRYREPVGVAVARFYHAAGRYTDAVEFLQSFPHLGVGDLVDIHRSFEGEARQNSFEAPLLYLVADSMIQAGRSDAAEPLVATLLDQRPGFDGGYELFAEINEPDVCLEKFDALFARDPFEERPLIWSGWVLLRTGRLNEAERKLRKAIAIDPSDGEQGKGDRMRVYAVLADVMRAQGRGDEAKFFDAVVAAIRLAERADTFYEVGFLERAVAMYRESLNFFSDAYCIQSRLAVQLSDLGLYDEAEWHYERAFELMPDSFGRVESHCFGCEGAFTGGQAQGVAERVFARLVEEKPDKAQVHYLLGYLRSEQGRWEEAVASFQRAVALDPDYLNAWKMIHQAPSFARFEPPVRDGVVFNLLRLDPQQRRINVDSSSVADLAQLWRILEVNLATVVVLPDSVLPFPASQSEVTRAKRAQPRDPYYSHLMGYDDEPGSDSPRQAPRPVILRHRVLESALALIGAGLRVD